MKLVVLSVAFVTALLFPAVAVASPKSCMIAPDPVVTGSAYTVTAVGYRPDSEIGIMDYYGSQDTIVTTDGNGSATVTFTLPADAPTGPRMIMSEVYPVPYKASAAAACWADVI